jgi:4-hydroxyproline epimerase
MANLHRIQVVDSHTGGEPTRVVISGGPDLGTGPLSERVQRLSSQFDPFRSAVVNEPRGSDVLVGALLVAPHAPDCDFGVIFFNNVGPLGMCGHGTIGLMVTLAHLGRVRNGTHRIDTPVGPVSATLHPDGRVSVANVPSYRQQASVSVEVPGIGLVLGDVAWGGNWFFLVHSPVWELSIQNVETLTDVSWRIRQAVNKQGFPEVDHVELFGPPGCGGHSRNFVLCPGKAYDRSPCGTGTSAKLACLAADGKLEEGQAWIQEGILGSSFQGEYQWEDRVRGRVLPVVTGTAHVTAEATLILSDVDPFQWGIRPD